MSLITALLNGLMGTKLASLRARRMEGGHFCAPFRRKRWKRRLRDHGTRVNRCGRGR